jgi:hypothetical protein
MQQAVIYRTLRIIEHRAEFPLAAVCLYEAKALTFKSRYTPPLTSLAHEHKVMFMVFCGVLGVHVWLYDG